MIGHSARRRQSWGTASQHIVGIRALSILMHSNSGAVQVIVKYAEIVLTPERPEYGGGVWHVEGMENEAICASCIAYLASDNITESRLHFRSMVADPDYEQNGRPPLLSEVAYQYGRSQSLVEQAVKCCLYSESVPIPADSDLSATWNCHVAGHGS